MPISKELLLQLPTLSQEELEQLRLRILALQVKSLIPDQPLPQKDWLLQGLTLTLQARGLLAKGRSLPVVLVKAEFVPRAESVRRHLLAGIKGELKYVEKVAFAAAAMDALADYLMRRKVPLSPKSILLGFENNLPPALEEAYPGYWGAGLLGHLVGNSMKNYPNDFLGRCQTCLDNVLLSSKPCKIGYGIGMPLNEGECLVLRAQKQYDQDQNKVKLG